MRSAQVIYPDIGAVPGKAVSNRPLPDPAVQARMAGVWHGYSQTLMALPAAPWVGMVLLQTKRAELCRRRLLAMVKMQNWRQRQQDFQQSEVFAKWIIVHDQISKTWARLHTAWRLARRQEGARESCPGAAHARRRGHPGTELPSPKQGCHFPARGLVHDGQEGPRALLQSHISTQNSSGCPEEKPSPARASPNLPALWLVSSLRRPDRAHVRGSSPGLQPMYF
nr:PREDICTED: uncharacterized protein LOC106485870 isoform X2 [Apteryx mantelli mantelli]